MKKFIIIFITIATLNACSNKQTEKTKTESPLTENTVTLTEAELKNAGIETNKPEQKNIASILRVNGKIDVPPQNMLSVSVPLGGYLKSTNLLPGMHISKGDVIAVMEDQEYITMQENYLTAKAGLILAEAEYNRQKELNASKASSDKIFQQAQNNYTTQKILVKSLSEKLKLISVNPDKLDETNLSRSISIYSPIDGYVSAVNVNIGKYVNPSDILFEIVNPQDIHLALTVFEKDINQLAIGQKIFAYTNSNPEKKYLCEIILIGKDLSHDRSIVVHCHFKNYDKTLIPGMFMNAEVEIQSANAVAVPSEAVLTFKNKQYVFVDKSNSGNHWYEMVEVVTGNTKNGFTAIKSENATALLQENIVTKGAYNLLMKMKNTEE
ncbi:MAG: Multidrug resistance protein MdtA [Bacteroidia bacterium]|nr:Multidrug resistance protein MdtA [Bacteroidia bacterium]